MKSSVEQRVAAAAATCFGLGRHIVKPQGDTQHMYALFCIRIDCSPLYSIGRRKTQGFVVVYGNIKMINCHWD